MTKSKLWTKSFLLDATVNFLVYLVYYLLMVMIAGYAMSSLNASPSQAGLAVGVFIVGALVSRICAGSIIDQVGRKRTLYIGLLVFLITTVMYFRATGLLILCLIRFLHGIGFGITSTATGTLAANLVPADRRGEGISYYAMSTTLASAVGPFLGMYLNQHVSFHSILILSVGLLVISYGAAFFLKVTEEKPQETVFYEKKFSASSFLEYRALPIAATGAVVGFSYSSIMSFLSSYTSEIHLAEAGSFFFLVYSIAILISRPLTGKLFDLKNENYVMYPAFVLFAVGMAALGQARHGFTLLAAAAFIGLGFGTFLSCGQAIAVKLAPSHRIGLATSTFLAIMDTGVGVGPFLLGILEPVVGFRSLYMSVAFIIIASMGMYYLLHGRTVSRISPAGASGEVSVGKGRAYAEE
ncbi:MAG: MFS transporter [Lacrimispora sp.]|uniref:MFS transporter n=1 Tax=Lacrimispora sp. TaxID=2719234 RepID=UPI0039E39F75